MNTSKKIMFKGLPKNYNNEGDKTIFSLRHFYLGREDKANSNSLEAIIN